MLFFGTKPLIQIHFDLDFYLPHQWYILLMNTFAINSKISFSINTTSQLYTRLDFFFCTAADKWFKFSVFDSTRTFKRCYLSKVFIVSNYKSAVVPFKSRGVLNNTDFSALLQCCKQLTLAELNAGHICEIFVAFLQGYIFCLLSSIFIGMAVMEHEHH